MKTLIGQLVAEDYRLAAVFSKYGIDFCCNGKRTIEEACSEINISTNQIIDEINEVINEQGSEKIDYDSFSIDLLSKYIEQKHHRYVEEQVPVIKGYLKKISAVHGNRHPELHEILELFEATSAELTQHMKREELMLFPQVRKMYNDAQEGRDLQEPPFGSFENPISVMMKDHTDEGERFRKIRALSNNFTVPEDGCNTYNVAYKLLEEFEKDLHLHIHLENNILFPKAIELEMSHSNG